MKHMRWTQRKHGESSDKNTSQEVTKELEDITNNPEDAQMATTNPDPLEDWQGLRQDVEDLEAEQAAPLVDVSDACPTCDCSAAL